MEAKKLSIAKTIKKYTNENGFSWGINTVMKSLAPNVEYNLIVVEGTYTIDKWNSTLPKPTSQQIRDEYIRQQTIAECLEHFKNIKK
jgi:hypothetical protein